MYFQIGLVVLIGLSAKNAILIVEFAAQEQAKGLAPFEAALEAARLRFRPIVMTSLAFVLGVLPLVLAGGAGAGARRSMGTGVFGGMIAATFVATLFIPMFFVMLSRTKARRVPPSPAVIEETSPPVMRPRLLLHAAAVGCIAALAGCMIGLDYQRPSTPVPASYPDEPPPANLAGAPIRSDWWMLYDDPTLNTLLASALRGQSRRVAFFAGGADRGSRTRRFARSQRIALFPRDRFSQRSVPAPARATTSPRRRRSA